MKRILFIIAFCSPLLAQAQSIEHILKSIEQNNKELKAQKHAADAHFFVSFLCASKEIKNTFTMLFIKAKKVE